MTKKIIFRVVAGLVLLVAIAGIGFFAYRAGVASGVATNIQLPADQDGAQTLQPFAHGIGIMHMLPFGRMGRWHMFPFGFSCFGPLVALFLICLAFGAMRRLFWGPRWGWHHRMHGHGPWSEKGEEFVPPMFKEWHKRAHDAPATEEKPEDKKAE